MCYENYCHCAHGYATFITDSTNPIIYCDYKLKSKYAAFFFELFFPFGAGHLYAENKILAMIKFVSFSMIICTCCGILFSIAMDDKNYGIKCFSILFILMTMTWVLFECIDLVSYAFCIYNDGNGLPLI